jgi:hypothetical protein
MHTSASSFRDGTLEILNVGTRQRGKSIIDQATSALLCMIPDLIARAIGESIETL